MSNVVKLDIIALSEIFSNLRQDKPSKNLLNEKRSEVIRIFNEFKENDEVLTKIRNEIGIVNTRPVQLDYELDYIRLKDFYINENSQKFFNHLFNILLENEIDFLIKNKKGKINLMFIVDLKSLNYMQYDSKEFSKLVKEFCLRLGYKGKIKMTITKDSRFQVVLKLKK